MKGELIYNVKKYIVLFFVFSFYKVITYGNVATVLGRLFIKNGHTIQSVISQNIDHAKTLADEFLSEYNNFSKPINMDCDLVIISVSDYGIENIITEIIDKRKPVVHTSGSVSKDILKKYSDNYGVLYPLQTIRKEMETIPLIPFLVDGSSEEMTIFLEKFAQTVSDNVQRASDEQRCKMHLAAVIASNFSNYMYCLAEEYCINEKVDFNILKPLILETANRVQQNSPCSLQTGPAIRKDIQTMDKHLRLLTTYPKLRTTYLRITDSIMNP